MALRTFQVAHMRPLVLNGSVVLYTVPAGHTLIVKDVRVANAVASTLRVTIAVRRAGTPVAFWDRQLVGPTSLGESCWVVLEPGDELIANAPNVGGSDVSGLGVVVSGALLQGVV